MARRLRRFGGLLLLLALGAGSYAATERVYDPDRPAAQAATPAARPGEIRAADGQPTRGRDPEEVAPVALVGALLLVGGLFLLTLKEPRGP